MRQIYRHSNVRQTNRRTTEPASDQPNDRQMKGKWNFWFLLHFQSHKFECVCDYINFVKYMHFVGGGRYSAKQLLRNGWTFTMTLPFCWVSVNVIVQSFHSYMTFSSSKQPPNSHTKTFTVRNGDGCIILLSTHRDRRVFCFYENENRIQNLWSSPSIVSRLRGTFLDVHHP